MPEPVQMGVQPSKPAIAQNPKPRTIVLWLQGVTLAWMLVEFGVSAHAAFTAHSPAMLAFGSDSLVELLSATVVLLQWIPSMPISERRASRAAGALLFVLAFVVATIAVGTMALRLRPEASLAGIGITLAALIAMPVLAFLKRREARRSNNRALAADAVQSATCAYNALITLVGLVVKAAFHIAWFDSIAALAAAPFLIKEGISDVQRAQSLANFEKENRNFTRVPRPGSIGVEQVGETRDRVNKAFRSYARTGQIAAEYRDLLTTSDATGGALIPQEFFPELTNALKFYGPTSTKVKQRITDGTGRPLKVSLGNDTQNGLVLLATEGTSAPAETDPTFQSKLVGTDTVSGGLVKISVEEMADSSFNLDSAIRDYFGLRYGRGMETVVTTGKDSSGTTLPNQSTGGLLGAATVGTTTAALANGIGWDDLVNLTAALDPAYTITPSWVMNSNTRASLIGLKDGFGRPYFTPDPSGDSPLSKLLGWPIVLNQAMPNAGVANATPILFGDLEKSYLLRTDGAPSIIRLNERFMDVLEIGFLMFSRVGGVSLAAGVQPIVSLKLAAS